MQPEKIMKINSVDNCKSTVLIVIRGNLYTDYVERCSGKNSKNDNNIKKLDEY